MSRRRILTISNSLGRLQNITKSLELAGAEFDAVQSVEQIPSRIASHRYVFFAVDEDVSKDEFTAVLDRLHEKAHITIIVPKANLETLVWILEMPRVHHVMVGEKLKDGVQVTAQKLLTGDIFGIEKYLPSETEVHYLRLSDFEGRTKAIDTILHFAQEKKVRRQIRGAIGQVCEELLMNALYDAPVDEVGTQIFAHLDPHDRTKAKSPKPVSIRFAATESQFAIAVRDRFGCLAKSTVLAYLSKCLTKSDQIDRKTYGAGLGLYMVANTAASYVVNVAHGFATEVICTFDLKTKTSLRLMGVFVHPGS